MSEYETRLDISCLATVVETETCAEVSCGFSFGAFEVAHPLNKPMVIVEIRRVVQILFFISKTS